MAYDELDNIMDRLSSRPKNMIRIPFTLPGVQPGNMVSCQVQFIVRQLDEGGMTVELIQLTPPPEAPKQGDNLPIVPSPS